MRVARRRARNHDSRNVGYVHFEQLFGDRNSVLHVDGVTVVAVDSTEPDLDHGQIGRGRYRWIEEQFEPRGRPADLRPAPSSAARPGNRARAERRLRRRRRDRVPAARRSRPRPVGPQARAVCVAARGSLRRQHGDRLVAAPPREHEALLQPRRDDRDARGRLAQVPVPRAGEDHPVLHRHARVREVHGADRGRGDDACDARDRPDRRRALCAGRARRAGRAALRLRRRRSSSAEPRS